MTEASELPKTTDSLVLRTDLSDDSAWEGVCDEIRKPNGEFRAYVECVSDRKYYGITVDQLVSLAEGADGQTYLFAVDSTTLAHPEHPVLVIDLYAEPGRTFRAIPAAIWSVENNLSLANMDFEEFADNADAEGVFRGFPE